MRKIIATSAIALLALTGCSSSDSADETTTTEATATTEAAAVPANCTTSASDNTFEDETGIGAALADVPMPDGVILVGTQTVTSTDDPGSYDVVARVCSSGLDEASHRSVATDLATAAEGAERPEIASMRVSSWIPEGKYTNSERTLLIDDYELYLWSGDFADGIEPVDRWEVSSS